MALKPDDRIMVLAPVVRGRKGEVQKRSSIITRRKATCARVWMASLWSLDRAAEQLDRRKNHTIS